MFSLTAGFPLVHKYGFHGSGAGQFAFSDDGPSGGICFTPDANTLLVRAWATCGTPCRSTCFRGQLHTTSTPPPAVVPVFVWSSWHP